MRSLTVEGIVSLHRNIILQSGGSDGLRDRGALESAVAQPMISFGGEDLYPTIIDKAAALGFSLVQNHPFIDGNKRVGHAAMEVFLVLNGYEIGASIDEQERTVLAVASGQMDRRIFTAWVKGHTRKLGR